MIKVKGGRKEAGSKEKMKEKESKERRATKRRSLGSKKDQHPNVVACSTVKRMIDKKSKAMIPTTIAAPTLKHRRQKLINKSISKKGQEVAPVIEVVEKIGKGGHSTVWKGFIGSNPVALKQVNLMV